MSKMDVKELRNAFGQFMTGVTVVTTLADDGSPLGFTANSFSSVSLDPPLLLVCLAKSANSIDVFSRAEGFAINILAEDQVDVSNTFARPVDDRFAVVDWRAGPAGSPVFDGVCAWFDCRMEQQVDAGDHVILIGRVEAFENHSRSGLGYASGGYFTRSLEVEAARIESSPGRSQVAAVVFNQGKILLQGSDQDGWRLPVSDKKLGVAVGQRKTLEAKLKLQLSDFYLFSIYDDSEAQMQHVVYRCVAEGDCAGDGQFVELSALQGMNFSDPAEESLIKRYVGEQTLGNFKIYLGDKISGVVQGD